jgi:predicted phage terminase large subunit-like protein
MDIKSILNDRDARVYACSRNFKLFTIVYFSHFLKYQFASFHDLFFDKLSDDSIENLALLAFRESAKTVFSGIFYPTWCIAYKKRFFIEFVGADHVIATKRLQNLSRQLQINKLFINDFGNLYFEDKSDFKQKRAKRVSYFETTNGITCVALGINQTPRGDLFDQFRPDLLIGDDIDNMKTVRNPEIRKESLNRLHGEFLGGLADNARSIISGNMIHRDCLMANLEKRPDVWDMIKVPVRDSEGRYAWGSRWNYEKEERMKAKLGIHVFNQEFLLKPIGDDDQIIKEEWINYYTTQLKLSPDQFKIVCFVDPAVKEKETSDYTAIEVWCKDLNNDNAYCLALVRERMPVEKILLKIKSLYDYWHFEVLGIEDVAAQYWLIQLVRSTYPEIYVKSIKRTKDKTSRLRSVQYLFQQGKVFFNPQHQIIVDELVDFPVAAHDDTVDACIDSLHELYRSSGSKLIQSNEF